MVFDVAKASDTGDGENAPLGVGVGAIPSLDFSMGGSLMGRQFGQVASLPDET
ncbi:hypothetical protein AO385_0487 [Moraxella catarrhalis]|nr:hypothetical protein AO385_0487 [Moraxella catarrhalis]